MKSFNHDKADPNYATHLAKHQHIPYTIANTIGILHIAPEMEKLNILKKHGNVQRKTQETNHKHPDQ